MKALEFQTKMDPEDSLRVPKELAAQIPKDRTLQVIVLFPEVNEEVDWQQLTQEQFFRGYAAGDSIYDAL